MGLAAHQAIPTIPMPPEQRALFPRGLSKQSRIIRHRLIPAPTLKATPLWGAPRSHRNTPGVMDNKEVESMEVLHNLHLVGMEVKIGR